MTKLILLAMVGILVADMVLASKKSSKSESLSQKVSTVDSQDSTEAEEDLPEEFSLEDIHTSRIFSDSDPDNSLEGFEASMDDLDLPEVDILSAEDLGLQSIPDPTQIPQSTNYMHNAHIPSYNYGHYPTPLSAELLEWKEIEDKIKENINQLEGDTANHTKFEDSVNISAALGAQPWIQSDKLKTENLLISLKHQETEGQQSNAKTADIVCVIDVSGSMQGEKLENVKKTLRSLLEFVKGSRISIVTFSHSAEMLMNFKIVNEENLPKIEQIIDYLHDIGSTNILGAVKLSQTLLKSRKTKNKVASVLLLSDGQHNSGPISNELMFNNDFEDSGTEYTLHTFGYGDDHDAELMQSMAERKHGNYYFVTDISKVDECFADCLGMVTSTLASKAKLTLKLHPSASLPELQIQKLFGPHWKLVSPTEATMDVGIIYEGFNKNLAIKISANAGEEAPKDGSLEDIASITLEYTVGDKEESSQLSIPLSTKVHPIDAKVQVDQNPEVKKQITRASGAEEIKRAFSLTSQGKTKEAIELLRALKLELENDSDLKDDSLIKSMIGQCKEMITLLEGVLEGRGNLYSTSSYIAQASNIYIGEMSAPQYDVSGDLYQNSFQKKNVERIKSKKTKTAKQ